MAATILAKFAVIILLVTSTQGSGGYTSFSYGVSDPSTGDVKDQYEKREGGTVVGKYSLIDSDGTKRTVEYSASDSTGFKAVVHKERVNGAPGADSPQHYPSLPHQGLVGGPLGHAGFPVSYPGSPIAAHHVGPLSHPGDRLTQAGEPVDHPGGPAPHAGDPLTHDRGLLAHAAGPLAHAGGPLSHAAGPLAHAAGPLSHAAGPLAHAGGPLAHTGGPLSHAGVDDPNISAGPITNTGHNILHNSNSNLQSPPLPNGPSAYAYGNPLTKSLPGNHPGSYSNRAGPAISHFSQTIVHDVRPNVGPYANVYNGNGPYSRYGAHASLAHYGVLGHGAFPNDGLAATHPQNSLENPLSHQGVIPPFGHSPPIAQSHPNPDSHLAQGGGILTQFPHRGLRLPVTPGGWIPPFNRRSLISPFHPNILVGPLGHRPLQPHPSHGDLPSGLSSPLAHRGFPVLGYGGLPTPFDRNALYSPLYQGPFTHGGWPTHIPNGVLFQGPLAHGALPHGDLARGALARAGLSDGAPSQGPLSNGGSSPEASHDDTLSHEPSTGNSASREPSSRENVSPKSPPQGPVISYETLPQGVLPNGQLISPFGRGPYGPGAYGYGNYGYGAYRAGDSGQLVLRGPSW